MMKPRYFLLTTLVALCLAAVPAMTSVAEPGTKSKSGTSAGKSTIKGSMAHNPYLGAIVVEAATGRVLFEDQADTRGYPASMQKLMDLVIILEKLEHGQLGLQD